MKSAAARFFSAFHLRPNPPQRPRRHRHPLVPSNFRDPVGLAWRIMRSRDPAAYFALGATLLAAVAAPLDLLFETQERRLYERARAPHRPVIFVTGAPRSGTTLVAQALGRHLPVTYFNNLTSVFPRSPIVANKLLAPLLHGRPTEYRSFYGRTSGLSAENDALHLWDRWLGPDRYVVPERLDADTADAMRRFFGAYEEAFGRPILNKNNALATCAGVIARALPSAHFIFVHRNPAFAVQSILGARETIQGSRAAPYGVGAPDAHGPAHAPQPIADVCAQVRYHERKMQEQQRDIGRERLWIVEYEDFCREPYRLVERVASEILGVTLDGEVLRTALPPFHDANRVKLAEGEFDAIRRTLAGSSLGHTA